VEIMGGWADAQGSTYLKLRQCIRHTLLRCLIQHVGVIQHVGGGCALCKQVELARKCCTINRAHQQHGCCSGLHGGQRVGGNGGLGALARWYPHIGKTRGISVITAAAVFLSTSRCSWALHDTRLRPILGLIAAGCAAKGACLVRTAAFIL
jgi:hypothetical protein